MTSRTPDHPTSVEGEINDYVESVMRSDVDNGVGTAVLCLFMIKEMHFVLSNHVGGVAAAVAVTRAIRSARDQLEIHTLTSRK